MPHIDMMSREMKEAIHDCQECHSVCTETLQHCLQMGGEHVAPDHIRLMLDCIEICETCADFMLRGSVFHTSICGVCADICERCAEDCDRFTDDAMMKACADVCRRCAASCRRMSQTVHAH